MTSHFPPLLTVPIQTIHHSKALHCPTQSALLLDRLLICRLLLHCQISHVIVLNMDSPDKEFPQSRTRVMKQLRVLLLLEPSRSLEECLVWFYQATSGSSSYKTLSHKWSEACLFTDNLSTASQETKIQLWYCYCEEEKTLKG